MEVNISKETTEVLKHGNSVSFMVYYLLSVST